MFRVVVGVVVFQAILLKNGPIEVVLNVSKGVFSLFYLLCLFLVFVDKIVQLVSGTLEFLLISGILLIKFVDFVPQILNFLIELF